MVLNVNHIIVSDYGCLGHLVKVVSIASTRDFFEVLGIERGYSHVKIW
jgi:hypothetical protein